MTQTENIRILLVDDHMVVRKGLFHVLDAEDDLSVVGEAENGEEALYICQKLKPDVVIMDIQMEGMGGIEATRMIAKHHPQVRIVALSTFTSREVISEILDAGAHGYLRKDISAAELTDAIRRVYAGETLQVAEMAESAGTAAEADNAGEFSALKAQMGTQQRRVLALMTKGFTNPEIAAHLSISLPTARYHVSAILQKFDVSNRAEATALAIRNQLVDESDF